MSTYPINFCLSDHFAHGKDTKVRAELVWQSGYILVRIEDEREQEHLQTAVFVEHGNEDRGDFQSDVLSNVEYRDSCNGTIPFLNRIGAGCRNAGQKYKDPLDEKDEDCDIVDDQLSEQGFTHEERMYFTQDSVTMLLFTSDDEFKPLGGQ